MSLSWYTIGLLALLVPGLTQAQTYLVVRDGAGEELRRLPAIVIADGVVATGRSGLMGAYGAHRLSSEVAGVIAEDQDADIVLLRLAQAQALGTFHGGELQKGAVLAGSGFATVVEGLSDIPGFGVLLRLRTEKNHPALGAPLWNDKGEIAAWYVPKIADGQRFSFGIPVSRLLCIAPRRLAPLRDWNATIHPESERQFSLSIGYFWLQDYDGASYHFRQFVLQNMNHARGWFYLAFAEGKMGRDRQKLAAYRKAVELEPLWGEPRYNLGLGLLLAGDQAAASAEAAALADVDPVMSARLAAYIELVHVDPLPAKPVKLAEPVSPRQAPR